MRYFIMGAAALLALYNWLQTESGQTVLENMGKPAEGGPRIYR